MNIDKTASVKALCEYLVSEKKSNKKGMAALEYTIAFQTKGTAKRFTQEELKIAYRRDDWNEPQGASKVTHLHAKTASDDTFSQLDGKRFEHIVIKRHLIDGYIDEHAYDDTEFTGNQLIDEIISWNKLVRMGLDDIVCPMLKQFTSKSDKVDPIGEKAQDNVIIISQKARDIGNLKDACKAAEMLGGEKWEDRYHYILEIAEEMGWRDIQWNGGNCGVIFDYAKRTYKAVIIDYAL